MQFSDPAPNTYEGDLWGRLEDDVNTLSFEDHWCRTAKFSVILGTTIWDHDEDDRLKIAKGDIVFNSTFYKITDALTVKGDGHANIVDAESLALHELGHLLGLSHVSGADFPRSIMTSSIYIGGGVASRVLDQSDVERVRYIYVPGSAEPPSGSGKGKGAEWHGGPERTTTNPVDCVDWRGW